MAKKKATVAEWILSIFRSNTGLLSSKRVIGVLCALALIIALFITCFTGLEPSSALVDAIAILCFGCLGLTSFDDYTKVKGKLKTTHKIESSEDTIEETYTETEG